MTDMSELFERHAAWQAGRRNLSWPEKVRMAEAIRESVIRLRNMRSIESGSVGAEKPKPPHD